jgi:hypothetical protein
MTGISKDQSTTSVSGSVESPALPERRFRWVMLALLWLLYFYLSSINKEDVDYG